MKQDQKTHTAPSTVPSPEKAIFRQKLWRLTQAVLLLGLILCVVLLVVRNDPLIISHETTALTEPLSANGDRVDYFKALDELYPDTLGEEENAFALLVREIGPGGFSKLLDQYPTCKQSFYSRLGLSPDTPSRTKWVSLDDAIFAYLADKYAGQDQLHERNARWALYKDSSAGTLDGKRLAEWNKECDELCRKWFADHEKVLSTIANAFRKNTFSVPWYTPDASWQLLLEFQKEQNLYVKELSDLFYRRACLKRADGDLAGAMENILILRRIAHLILTTNPRFVQTDLAALNIDKQALIFDFSLHSKSDPGVDVWKKYLRECSEFTRQDFGERALDNNFVFGAYSILQTLSRNRGQASQLEIPIATTAGYNWNVVGQTLDQYRKNPAEAMMQEDFSIVSPEKNRLKRRYMGFFRKQRSRLLAWDICHAATPRLNAFHEAFCLNHCLENMQRIVLAMELYRHEHKTYPPAFTVDAKGQPLQSWRVLILPYLGEKEKALYEQIKLDEPWNSDANKAFHLVEIPVYACPSQMRYGKNEPSLAMKGKSAYAVVIGKDSLFDASGKGKPLPDTIPAETRNNPYPNILVAERHRPSCWMNPSHEILEQNLQYGVNGTLPRLRLADFAPGDPGPVKAFPACLDSLHRGVVVVGLPNGSLKLLPQTIGGAL